MIRSLLLASAACALALPAAAETVAIVNARIEPVSGPAIPTGTLVIKDGKIAALGASVAVPADAKVIDAKGGVVTPEQVQEIAKVEAYPRMVTFTLSPSPMNSATFFILVS